MKMTMSNFCDAIALYNGARASGKPQDQAIADEVVEGLEAELARMMPPDAPVVCCLSRLLRAELKEVVAPFLASLKFEEPLPDRLNEFVVDTEAGDANIYAQYSAWLADTRD